MAHNTNTRTVLIYMQSKVHTHTHIAEGICFCINTTNMLTGKTHSVHGDVYQDGVMVHSGGAEQTHAR